MNANHIRGGLWGLLIGDAVGVPYEFHHASRIPVDAEIEPNPPKGFHRAHPTVMPGTWSDDGAQALCLLASLLDRRELDLDDLGGRFIDWLRNGYMAVGGVVFDVGTTTSHALSRLGDGIPASQSGPTGERTNGNGSLMRVLPLALWHHGDDDALIADAMRQSLVTHGHLRSQLCCAVYCMWARAIMEARANPWNHAVSRVRRRFREDKSALAELSGPIDIDRAPGGEGSGYVVDCLHTARLAVEAGDYETVIKTAIAFGDDTDTSAAVAGGIAGLRDGEAAIPKRWRDVMREPETVETLLERLLAR